MYLAHGFKKDKEGDAQIISEKKGYAEAGGSKVWGQPGQHSEIFILENEKHCFNNLYF